MNLIDRLRALTRPGGGRRHVPHPRPAAWMHEPDPPWRSIEERPATADETVRLYTGERWQPEEDGRPMEHAHHPLDQEGYSDLDRELSQRPLRGRPSIETPIEPFEAPRDALDRIPHAYRAIAEDVVVAVSAMILKAEEARLMAVKFLEQCDQQGRWHSDFVHDYIAHETAAAEAYTAQWQKTIEELTAKRDAARQLTGPTTKPEEPKT